MGTKILEIISESMFYTLMAFRHTPMTGSEVTDWVSKKTQSRVNMGPGTLYTILSRFQHEGVIREISVDGRKRRYAITSKGISVYENERVRLENCILDAAKEEEARAEREGSV